MDKIALGRQGEIYVLRNLMDNGWKLSINNDIKLDGLDWIVEKDGRIIKIQVKTSEKKKITFGISKRTFDYLIITNLKDIWYIPIALIGITDKFTNPLKKCNDINLLEKKGYELWKSLNDLSIKGSNIQNLKHLFID